MGDDDELAKLRRLRDLVWEYEALSRKCYGRHDPAADYKDLFKRLAMKRLEMFKAAK